MPQIILVVLFPEFLGEFRPFRSRPCEAHFSAKNIPELWQFIEARTSKIVSSGGTARIMRHGPHRAEVAFGIFPHRAELDDREWLAAKSNTDLTVKNGTFVAQAYDQSNDGENGCKQD
jgi:hypothetical protein